jgi:magnesium chelatase subunit D
MIRDRLADSTWVAGLLALSGATLGGALVDEDVLDSFVDAYGSSSAAADSLKPVPASLQPDALTGALDLSATLAMGRPVHSPGLLLPNSQAKLLLRRAASLDHSCASLMAHSIDRGELLLIAADRFSETDLTIAPKLEERLAFKVTGKAEKQWTLEELHLARMRLQGISIDARLIDELCEAALALGIPSPRPVLQAMQAAKAIAALQGLSAVDDSCASLAARLVFAHRVTQLPEQHAPESLGDTESRPNHELPAESAADSDPADSETILESVRSALPEGLLALAGGARGAKAGSGRNVKAASAATNAGRRGRRVGHKRVSSLNGQRLDVLATLRSAAPWQVFRRKLFQVDRMLVTRDDFRVHRVKQRHGATAIFAVDASGSTAYQRLAEAKGAVEAILAECYVRRDRVALVAFRSKRAEQLLAPTRSLERAKRALANLPGGGGTPLAAGLDATFELALQVRHAGGNPVVVVLTDGRANVTRNGEGNKSVALEETQSVARLFASEGFDSMVIDVSPQPQQAARNLAAAMRARYIPMPQARAQEIAYSVSGALESASA